MTRRQIWFLVLLTAGLTVWGAVRPGKAAHAGTPPDDGAVAVDYAANGEDEAAHRWAAGQARHWRQLVVKR